MPAIKSVTQIKEKWARVTAQRSTDYADGVKSPKKDWATETKAAEGAYEEGVQAAIGRKAFGKGVDAAGTTKWQSKAIDVGVGRFPAGVTADQEDYGKGFAPFVDVISRTTLPQRFAKGDPRNYERVRVMGEALHAEKVK